jgi:pimeloyl-ACP methyl ester carboxylesterase
MPKFETTHSTIHFTDQGTGRPVLLVHGFPLSSDTFADVASLLAKNHRVISVDLPGFGHSTTVGPFSMASLARDCVELMQSLGMDRYAAAGLSMGGYVLLEMAHRFVQHLSHLILIDTKATADDEAGRQNRDRFVGIVRERGTPAIVELMYPKMMAATSTPLETRLKSVMNATPPLTIEYACCAMRDRDDFLDRLPEWEIPIQIIVGQHDVITPVEVAKQTAAASNGRLDVIENAGHLAPLEQPQAVAKVIEQFLGDRP